jgi:uncharacterized protein YdhG (YjbR/CyaY superfamily)
MSQNEIDAYLNALPDDQRKALEDLAGVIRRAVPDATETLSYGVPAWKHKRPIVSMGAGKEHCSFFVQSPAVMDAHREELKGYDTAKGTVRFKANDPLPDTLVTMLVKARVAENEALDLAAKERQRTRSKSAAGKAAAR